MVLEAADKPRSRIKSFLRLLGLAILVLALLVLPSRALAGRLVERLDIFDTFKRKDVLHPLRGWRTPPPQLPPPSPPSLEQAQTASVRMPPPPLKAPPSPKPPMSIRCELDLGHSPFERSCTRLEDACVDQVGALCEQASMGASCRLLDLGVVTNFLPRDEQLRNIPA